MDKMIDKIFETVKKSLNGDKPFLRKLPESVKFTDL